ncbi:WD40 repeat-like protein [Coemansia reversa NRRL 1564]|uniref:WD40 repeat-like protein n=1 Tax=Coemansia reversa (strain ATCC 12441 / NRRL 1564) TaxID=763665 RepID=A0A2G5B4S2_COERN|nr:WD40 repeat-like protein [Coemansia reversa NRRL 1564]|eukprot:PIA13991.1 WD40 repeat-like protein [Coemansia reversa NRRL 1564]
MNQEQSIPVNHDDFIHDLAYNFYGTRLATCGSDRCIKIWDWNKQTGLWILNESIQAHDSSVVRLSWAHPEFGQVLASCSLDRTVRIWVEQESSMTNSGSRWRGMTTIADSAAVVHSIAFAPEYTSLSIAAASSDGRVRLYSPTDPVRLSNWTVNHQIELVPGGATDSDGPLSVSWCKSRFSSQRMLVVGGSKYNRVKVFQLVNSGFVEAVQLDQYDSHVLDVDWAPTMGRSYHLIATACADGHIRIYKFWSDPALAKTHLADSLFVREGSDPDDSDASAEDAAAEPGDDGDSEDSIGADDSDSDSDSDDLDSDSDSDSEADDESEDESGGGEPRSEPGHSSGGGAGSLPSNGLYANDQGHGKHTRKWKRQGGRRTAKSLAPRSELVGDITVQPSVPIRRVRWNGTGTLLVSSSDDGVVRIWKMTVNGTWREITAIAAEKSAGEL